MTASTPAGPTTGFDQASTLVAAIEVSDKSWVIGAHVHRVDKVLFAVRNRTGCYAGRFSTYVRNAALRMSFACFGRRADRSACHCAVVARYSRPPLWVAALRRNSREIVDAVRPSCRAISRLEFPCT